MAKLNSLFKYDGTFQGVTVVRSRAYGHHIRKARTKFTLSEEMKQSTDFMKEANVYAKAFKDAIDPYRRDFRDGFLWQRLVSLFKKQLKEKGLADFKVLDGVELNKFYPLSRIVFTNAQVSQSEGFYYCYSLNLRYCHNNCLSSKSVYFLNLEKVEIIQSIKQAQKLHLFVMRICYAGAFRQQKRLFLAYSVGVRRRYPTGFKY